ncbi:Protein EKL-6 [Aphelenchoides avenae]|nr:Protein EKL-6 [Aphelenchus avenae]
MSTQSELLDTLFRLLEAATKLSENGKEKVVVYAQQADPVKILVDGLVVEAAGTPYDAEVAERVSNFVVARPGTSHDSSDGKPMPVDYRPVYTDIVAFLLEKLADALRGSISKETDAHSVLSVQQIAQVSRSFQFLSVIAVLSSLDEGSCLKQRSNLIKSWSPYDSVSTRIVSLDHFVGRLLGFLRMNIAPLTSKLLSEFLPDLIVAHEQTLKLGGGVHKDAMESLLRSKLPRKILFRELLSLSGGFGLRPTRQATSAPSNGAKWLQDALGKRLSRELAKANSLVYLFLAFDDLGGDAFWENSAAMHAVSAVLTAKSRIASTQSSATTALVSLFRQLVQLVLKEEWTTKLQLLFGIVVETLSRSAPEVVHLEFFEKFVGPFEVLVLKGASNEFNGSYGHWTRTLDDALFLLATWTKSLACSEELPLQRRFLKGEFLLNQIVQPRLEHFPESQWNVQPLVEKVVAVEADAHAPMRYPVCLGFASEIVTVEEAMSIKLNGIDQLLLSACVRAWHQQAVSDTEAHVSISRDEFRFVRASELQPCVERSAVLLRTLYVLSYLAESFAEKIFDFSTDSLLELLEIANELIDWNVSKFQRQATTDVIKLQDDDKATEYRSLQLAVSLVAGTIAAPNSQDETVIERLKTVLGTMRRFNQVVDGCGGKLHPEVIEARETCKTIVDLLRQAIGDIDEPRATSDGTASRSRSCEQQATLDDVLRELDDPLEPVRGHALVVLTRALRQRNSGFFTRGSEDFDEVFGKLVEHMKDEDTYVFLASINAMAELAFWKTEPYLERMVERFVDWSTQSTADADNDVLTARMMLRGKMGEAIAKVCKQLGDFSPVYYDRLSGAFFALTRDKEELIRASALGGYSDLILACRGKYFDRNIHEILLCISRLLTHDPSAVVRRSSIHLLRSILSSTGRAGTMFEVMAEPLRDITRQLRRLRDTDVDDVVQFHANAALSEVEAALRMALSPDTDTSTRKVRI